MRFLEDGPNLPDELLTARDEGRVLFFCGAGVSQEAAHLPGFLELAKQVLKNLRALPDSSARKLVEVATELQARPIEGVGGVIAADRIFGLLERDFALSDIERAVAKALRPTSEVNAEPHRILLDLSRNPAGEVQLVTTNFDLLFEAVAPRSPTWTPSQLPDLRRYNRFDGIVHLHGMLNHSYSGPVGGNLVLSSAEFGRAYLAEGWATDFIRAAIDRYSVVFVGYTADDPPVQYLLEALNRTSGGQSRKLYAFQSGRPNDADILWKQKGVNAIAYPADQGHTALWGTLKLWVERARNPERWRAKVLRRAAHGPAQMKPHERGQVVHLASTAEGARGIAEAKRPIPAEWLCTFDPNMRYGTPGPARFILPNEPEIDPFDRYGLDSDVLPAKRRENEIYKRRETPREALDVLLPLPLDGQLGYTAGLKHGQAGHNAQMPQRLASLSNWFARIYLEPAALWWASGQNRLHPAVLTRIQFELDRDKNSSLTAITIWRYLFDAWQPQGRRRHMDGYALNDRISREGWTLANRRAYLALERPSIEVSRPYSSVPPGGKEVKRIGDVASVNVAYPDDDFYVSLPDTEITKTISPLRHLLEEITALEGEICPFNLNHIPPIEPDPKLPGESSDRDRGFNARVLGYADLFKKLLAQDRAAASAEYVAWPPGDHAVFSRLRVWAAGLPNFLPATEAGAVLMELSDRIFWSDRAQRDVLIALGRRWNELGAEHRKLIGNRLRKGLPKERWHDAKLYPRWRAYSIADRLGWLSSQGCKFDFDVEAEIIRARAVIPEWTADDAADAAASQEGRGGNVHVDTTFADIEGTSIESLMEVALTANRRRHGFLEERNPYAGLVEKRPARVLAALRRTTAPSERTAIGWAHFLQSSARRQDKPKFMTLIAWRLTALSTDVFTKAQLAIAYWIEIGAEAVFKANSSTLYTVFDRLVASIAEDPEGAFWERKAGPIERDWAQSSWHSMVGHLARTLASDPMLKGGGALPRYWMERIERLLGLPGDHGRFALVSFMQYLSWFFDRVPVWTEERLIAPLTAESPNQKAAVAGFLSNASVNGYDLFRKLMPVLVAFASEGDKPDQTRDQAVAALCVSAWKLRSEATAPFITDDELRTVIVRGNSHVRTNMLWQIAQWDTTDKLRMLRDVWPLQLAARGSQESARLASMAFEAEEQFVLVAEAVIPLLTPLQDHETFFTLTHGKEKVFDQYSDVALAMLFALLSERVSEWPYGADAVLTQIVKANPKLRRDRRYQELRGRQNRAN